MQHSQSNFAFHGRLLKTTVSAGAIAAWIAASPAAYAQSSCDITNPMTGDTVTCTFGTDPGTNDATPIFTGINAPGAENVDLTIIDPIARSGFDDIDASFSGGTPTIALGGGAQITIRNVSVGNTPVVGEAELSQEDLSQAFQEPYGSFFTDFIAAFDGGALPTRAQLQQVIDTNGLNYMLADTDPLDDITTAFVAAFNDAGVPTTVGFDEDGDAFLIFDGDDGEIIDAFGLPASGAAVDAFSSIFAEAEGSVISLGAPTDRSAIDPTVIERIATAPGTAAAVETGQNSLNLGVFGSDDGDIFAVGANGVDLAQGSVTTIRLFDDGIGVVGNNGAAVVLNAGGADASALELILVPGAEIATLGDNGGAVRVNGGNAVVGIASDVGSLTTLGNNSPLVSMTGGDSVLNLRLSELTTDVTIEFDAAGNGPYSTAGNDSPLFQVIGDNSRVFLSSNQVGVRNESAGFVSLGDDSTIFDFQIGAQPIGTNDVTVNFDFLNGKASTSGDRSSIINLSTGALNRGDLLFGNTVLETAGDNAAAIAIAGAINTNLIDLTITGGSITTSGEASHGVTILGGSDDGSTLDAAFNDAVIVTTGAASLGLDIGGTQEAANASLTFDGGSITTSGLEAHGARLSVTGVSSASIGTIALNNAQFSTEGDGAFALISSALSDDGSAASLDLTNMALTTQGVGAGAASIGLGASNLSVSRLTIADSNLTTSGDFADGLAVSSALLDETTGMSDMSGTLTTTTIATSGRFADALMVGENVTIYGPGVAAPTNGEAKLTVDTFEDFSATGLGSRGIQNNGVIEVTNTGITYGAGKTGRIANAGTINGTGGTAVTFAGDTDDIFELQPQAMTIGTVDGAGGTDTFILGGVGTDTFDTDLLDTQYVNFEVFEKEDLSTWTITSDDTRAWTLNGGELVVGTGTTITAGSASAFTISTGLTTQTVDDVETILPVRGQLTIDDGSSVISGTANVAAVSVAGIASVVDVDAPDGVRLINNLPDNFSSLSVPAQLLAGQQGADVTVAGMLTTTADGADGIVGTYGADLAPQLSAYLTGNGTIQTSGADASAIRGGDAGNYALTVFADGDSSITTTGDRAGAILASGSDNVINVVAEDDASFSTSGVEAHGIVALGGSNSVTFFTNESDVSLATIGDGALGIGSVGNTSIVSITADGSVSVSTQGNNAHALLNDGDGSVFSVTLIDDVSVTTAGDNAFAVRGPGAGSAFSLVAEGTSRLTTAGAGSSVIQVDDFDSSITSLDFNLGAERTQQALLSEGANSDLVSITANAEGQSTFVFSAEAADTAADVATFETLGDNSHLMSVNAGDESSLTGSLDNINSITRGEGSSGYQLATGDEGDLTISMDGGSLATLGSNTNALDLQVGGQGTLVAFLTNSVITTGGDDTAALFTSAGAGADVTVLLGSAVSATGTDGVGLQAVGSIGGTNVIDVSGSIITSGARGHAVWLDEQVENFSLSGTLTTTGDNAFGIGADGTLFGIVTTADSTITTSGVNSDAIWLEYTGASLVGDGSITMNGSLTTTGDMSNAIWVDRTALSSGGTTITVGGDIRTEGAQSHGISVFYGAVDSGTDGGGVAAGGTIIVSGDIDARGAGSDGIRTYLDDGASTNITIQAGGDVFAPGDGDTSIYLTSLAGASGVATANITVDASSETAARGNVYSSTGFAIAEGNDSATPLVINTNLTVAGNVSAGGNDRAAIDLSTGDDTVTVTEDGFIGGTVLLGSGDDVLTLAGTLRMLGGDALNTGTGEDELIILPTASVTGGIDMGPGDDTLAFDGAAGTVGNVSLVADEVAFAIDVQRIEKRGEGTWIFEGDDIPTGAIFEPAFLLNGTSRVQAQYSGIDTTVSAPARLEGNGGVGNLLNAGTLAPGVDGVGTFTVAGGLTLEPTSVLEIDIAADGTSDLIAVGLDAVLDGALAVNGVMYPTGFPNEEDYVIITAEADIFGEFSSVTDNLPDVDVTVAYNDNDVTISYDKGQDLSDKSIQANTVQSGLVDGRLFAETLRRRGVLMGAAGGFASAGNVQLAQNGAPTDIVNGGRKYAVWAAAMGALAEVDSTPAQTGYDIGMGGIASGFDGFVPLDDGMIRLGVAFGYSMGDIDNASSGADVNTWHLGAHAVYEKDKFGISGALSYGFQNYEIERVIELTGAPAVVTQGEANGNVFSASVGAKYTVYESDTFSVSPIAHVEHVSAKRGAYTETGAGILNLAVDAERFDRTFIGAGVRLDAESEGAGGIVYKPQLDLMYEHAFGDRTAVVTSTAANLQTIDFTTRGGQEARSQVAVGAGMAMQISDRVSAHVRYDGSYASNFISHRGSAGLSFSF